jgi:hypothetical protein
MTDGKMHTKETIEHIRDAVVDFWGEQSPETEYLDKILATQPTSAYERAVIEQAMVTECVNIEGRDPTDIIRDIISWHVGMDRGARNAKQPRGEVDGCTEPNCPRCLTAPHARGEMEHAGIGSYPSSQPKAATEKVRLFDIGTSGNPVEPLYTHPAPSQAVATAGDGVTDGQITAALTADPYLNTAITTGPLAEVAYAAYRLALASPSAPRVGVPEGYVAVPIYLPALAVSEIKDIIARDYGLHSTPARPLWAKLLEIVHGISVDDQVAFVEARFAAAPEVPK